MEAGDQREDPTRSQLQHRETSAASSEPGYHLMTNNVGSMSPTTSKQQLIEELAQKLVDDALEDAFEHYLRRELQQTAEESVRGAIVAATSDAGQTGETENQSRSDLTQKAESSNERDAGENHDELRRNVPKGHDELDKQSDDDDCDEEELERTLTYELGGRAPQPQDMGGNHEGQEDQEHFRATYSMSPPSQLDADDIFRDLNELSSLTDRIDSILEQTASEHSTRSGRMRSVSPMPMAVAFEQQQYQEEEGLDGEVD